MELGLKGKIACVTGAAGGIGAGIARALCSEQATTIFADIDAAGLERAVKGYETSGSYKVCDVTNRENVKHLFTEIANIHGALHILVNCAALNTADYIEDIKENDIDRVFDVNIRGYINTTVEAVPLMKKACFGRLIYINSGSGLKASAGLALYSASKYFDRGFAISAALELGRYNITSNSICPSDVYPFSGASVSGKFVKGGENTSGDISAGSWNTESLQRISFEKEGVSSLKALIEKRIRANPMRRSCTIEDIANLALFLASERAGFINGQSIGLNGGALPY